VEMEAADAVLAKLQEMLLGFQADLGGLSGDIRSLQEQSKNLGIQLRNRKDAELGLRCFLSKIVIPPNLADVICHGDVDGTFVDCVKDLNAKYEYVQQMEAEKKKEKKKAALEGEENGDEEDKYNDDTDDDEDDGDENSPITALIGIIPSKTKAANEMYNHIYKLRLRAVTRTRDYFLSKISDLRRPKTNVRIIQVNALLKYDYLIDFLAEASPDIYTEIRDVYVESMSKTLHALFRTYHHQLSRLEIKVATRNDLIAIEDSSLRDVFSTKVNMNKRGDTFFLGDRAAVLDSAAGEGSSSGGGGTNASATATRAAEGPILAHVALAEGQRYPYEQIFRSVMMHLINAATNEYVFTRQFFKEYGSEAFTNIFSRTLGLMSEQLENYLFHCHDALCLLLMIKLTHSFRRIMKRRKINSLDGLLDRMTNLLWPRLKMIIDAQIRSVKNGNAKKLGGVELHAHYISRRYAEFTCSILLILNRGKSGAGSVMSGGDSSMGRGVSSNALASKASSSSSGAAQSVPSYRGSAGDMLVNDVSTILDETVLLLERLADEHKTNKKRIVFLINNYDQIIGIFRERRCIGREMNKFVDLLMSQRELFVEEELLHGFSKMIAFVRQTESEMTRLATSSTGMAAAGLSGNNSLSSRIDYTEVVNPNVVEALVREFSTSWKTNIEQINRNVLSYFSNFRNGMEILKQVLTQLLLYYTRFQDIIRRVWRSKPPAFCKDLVSTTAILAEIKKYALAI